MTKPFFVVDRPMSLNILKYSDIDKQNSTYGLMGHANTSGKFQDLFRDFSGDNIIKAADSGVFTKEGCLYNYQQLFKIYNKMNVDFGIMVDYLKDKEKTIQSAKRAIKCYDKKNCFKLIGVAQGKSLKEYLDCYKELKNLGFNHIAIGGLLTKHVNSARYVHVQDQEFIIQVIREIRKEYGNDWLFLLGCYHPNRHLIFEKYNIFGGDYKGWIFNYKTPEVWIDNIHKELIKFEYEFNNEKLIQLVKKREIFLKNMKKNRKNKKFRIKSSKEIMKIDIEILRQRKKNFKKFDKNYEKKLEIYEKLLYMDTEQKRDYRFKQIRSYLENNVFSISKDKLLLISCSDIKKDSSDLVPAINLYNGPYFKSIRKLKKGGILPNNIHTMIISAEYGLIGLYDLIHNYDKIMNKNRASELSTQINKKLSEFIINKQYKEVMISMGKNYQLTLKNFNFDLPVTYCQGRIGQKLSKTIDWVLKE